jgi:hypothetical protein
MRIVKARSALAVVDSHLAKEPAKKEKKVRVESPSF